MKETKYKVIDKRITYIADVQASYENNFGGQMITQPLGACYGEYLQIEYAIPEDLQKSLATGCLRNFIDRGWIIAEIIEKEDSEDIYGQNPYDSKPMREEELEDLSIDQLKELLKKKEEAEKAKQSKPSQISEKEQLKAKILWKAKKASETPQELPTNDSVAVKPMDFDSFNKLKHFEKLAFIAKCEDKAILDEIIQKATIDQLKLRAVKRKDSLK